MFAANRFTVVLDSNVLFGALHRNVALSLAEAGLYRPRWSTETLVELQRPLGDRIGSAKAAKHLSAIDRAFPDAAVQPLRPLVEGLVLPDAEDRHVLAAAITEQADLIATDNLKHFPDKILEEHGLSAVSSDQFFLDCITISELTAVAALKRMRERFDKPVLSAEALLLRMEQVDLTETADLLSPYLELL